MSRRPAKDWWLEERAARERGFRVIAGIDEAGRGPLAGPVVAACVVLPYEEALEGVRDSKTLKEEQREAAFERILERAEAVGIGQVEPADIDRLNILRATHQAMREALAALPAPFCPDVALIDGLPVHPFPIHQIALVKGDGRSVSIAAASIIAKVTRDRRMAAYAAEYPQYNFKTNKGYPTPDHLALLTEHGPCSIHRRSFRPVARLVEAEGDPGEAPADAGSLFEADRRELGESGEIVAAAHLRRMGLTIRTTRYRCRGGEVDIIAEDGGMIVFAEVKARRGGYRGSTPAEAVDAAKRKRILCAAELWLADNGGDRACRFDVIEVVFGRDGYAKVNVIRDAFMAGE